MRQYDIEDNLICCILLKDSLINELFVDLKCFKNPYNKRVILFFKEMYKKYKKLDITLMVNEISGDNEKTKFINYYTETIMLEPTTSMFYEYQQKLIDEYKDNLIKEKINEYSREKINLNELVENINKISNEIMIIKQTNKKTPEEMIYMIRNREKIIEFDRFKKLNEKLKIKKKTVNVIGARPSEGKSALALNLFCDLAKKYKCLYFNMEMTEEEVYERMLGIESDITIKDTYSAIARCDKVDTFDIELGKDLARSRALAKREEVYGQAINRIYEILNDTSNFITSIRNVVDLHNKHKTNAEAITVSGKTLKEIRGF